MELTNNEYESMLISALLQSGETIGALIADYRHHKNIGIQWFHSKEYRWIAGKIFDFVTNHSDKEVKPPSIHWMMNELSISLAQKFPEDPDSPYEAHEERDAVMSRYRDVLDRRMDSSVPLNEIKIWLDELIKLGRDRNILDLIRDSHQKIEVGDFEGVLGGIQDQIPNLTRLDTVQEIRMGEVFDESRKELECVRDRRDNPDKYRGWVTGIGKLDYEMGGLLGGEVGMVVGLVGKGKTACLRDIGIQAAYDGAKVCLISAEQSMDLARRQYLSRMSNFPYRKIKNGEMSDEDLDEAFRLLDIEEEKMKGRIEILDVPENCTVQRVKIGLRQKFKDTTFDMYLFDHLGIMLPSRSSGDRLDWKVQANIAEEVRVFARSEFNSRGERGIVAWMAVQANPSSMKKHPNKLEVTDVGLSYPIGWGAHCSMHIVRDVEMEENHEAFLKITKVRDGRGHFMVKVKTALDRCQFLCQEISSDEQGPIPLDKSF